MGDALCGPSNALQNLQKQASADRTLQQDRLTSSRAGPAQGFRSHDPKEGALDQVFDAFESSFAGTPFSETPLHPHHAQPSFVPPAAQRAPPQAYSPHPHPHHQPGIPGWASDFQKLQISNPPSAAPTDHAKTPTRGLQHAGNWQNEFNRQPQQRQQQPIQTSAPFGLDTRYGSATGGLEFARASQFPAYGEASQPSAISSYTTAETFDESAFEAAFAEAHEEIARQERNLEQQEDPRTGPETERIGSDRIPAHQDPNVNEHDALAQAAGQLLDSVSHDQSQKFKESNFLALMRQLRDRKVVVEGDEFRQFSQPLHPGGQFYPEQKKRPLDSETRSSNFRAVSNGGVNQRGPTQRREPVTRNNGKSGGGDSGIGESGFRRTNNDSFGDNNALYEGYPLNAFAVDRRAAHPLNCVFRNELDSHGL